VHEGSVYNPKHNVILPKDTPAPLALPVICQANQACVHRTAFGASVGTM